MIKYVPNILTCSRLLFAAGLVMLMLTEHPALAAICLLIGLSTDWLDGFIARKYHAESKLGKDVLEPICDLLLAAAAVTMLIVKGPWPLWAGIVLVIIPGLLQLIDFVHRYWRPGWVKVLKRHQNYLHPFYAVIVMVVTATTYALVFIPRPYCFWIWAFIMGFMYFTVASKADRIRELYHYQE